MKTTDIPRESRPYINIVYKKECRSADILPTCKRYTHSSSRKLKNILILDLEVGDLTDPGAEIGLNHMPSLYSFAHPGATSPPVTVFWHAASLEVSVYGSEKNAAWSIVFPVCCSKGEGRATECLSCLSLLLEWSMQAHHGCLDPEHHSFRTLACERGLALPVQLGRGIHARPSLAVAQGRCRFFLLVFSCLVSV